MKSTTIKSIIFILIILVISAVPLQAATVYYVRSGDSLWKIANRFDVPMDTLYKYNNISSNNWLTVGQKLIIDNKKIATTNSNIYYVKTGDTLWKIAQKYDLKVEDIIAHNNLNDYNIYVGQQLYLYHENNNNTGNNNSNNSHYLYYRIQAGDILWNIAQRYNTTVQKLVNLNNITDVYDLYVGRRLIIPGGQVEDNNPSANNMYSPYYFYRINEGDKIWTIADKFGIRVSELLNYNNLTDINEVEAGTLVVIPLQKSNKLAYIKKASSTLNNYYRVDGDDSLSNIAEYYNIAEEGLRAINNLRAEENIYIGQKLIMPVSPALFAKHKLYTVKQEGEYLFDIAYNHGVSIKSILKANFLKNPNIKFKAGTVIVISLTEESKVRWIDYENGKPVNSWIF